jgi:thioredoxin reductase
MERWRRVTRNVGMEFLRSPVVHHLGGRTMDLARFAGTPRQAARGRHFKGRYRRPALDLFNAHSEAVADAAGLRERWLVGAASELRRRPSGVWEVAWDDGTVRARNVVLAIGAGDDLEWPRWASKVRSIAASGAVAHVLEEDELPSRPSVAEQGGVDVAVGAGMSGAQLALRLAAAERRVVLLSRGPLEVSRFDTDPGWLGPKRMAAFELERCPDARRAIIEQARHRGSITEDVHHALRAAERTGAVEHVVGEVLGAAVEGSGLLLTLRESTGEGEVSPLPRVLRADRVLLATGYAKGRPGGAWLDEAIEREALPVAACGYPVPDSALRWSAGLFVTGPLADLELGPVARNIAGARRGAERIVAVAKAAALASTG